MADHPLFSISVVTPEGAAFEGDAEMLIVPGDAGEIGVLARHAPLVAMLSATEISPATPFCRTWPTATSRSRWFSC